MGGVGMGCISLRKTCCFVQAEIRWRIRMASVRFIRNVLFILSLIVLLAGPASGQITSQTGAVRIIVVDPQGAPVSEAKVTLNSPLGTTATEQTVADGSG